MRRLLLAAALAVAVLLAPANALAHPLGNFTVNRYAGITLAPGSVTIDYVIDLAEIPTVQVMPEVDRDGDGLATGAELQAWATATAPGLLSNLELEIAGAPVALEVVSASARERPGQGPLPTLRLEATFAGRAPDHGELTFADRNEPERIGWREITAAGIDGTAIVGADVPATSVTDGLLTYPQDLSSSPLDVRAARVSFEPGTSAPAADPSAGGGATRPATEGGALADLVGRSGGFMVVAVLLAFGFGAVHALGPGHGKTLMAAYLVGSGGRLRQAVAVGGSVALMHTASVLALGVLVLSATRVFAPERVYPWLGLVSGLIALGLGASLLVRRLGRWSGAETHGHPHRHEHTGDGAAAPDEGHPHPGASVLSGRGLMALAVAGGLLPSPTALVVLLGAVAVHRVGYGLGLIAAFSLGLATALVIVGVGALRARDALAARLSARGARFVPVLSATAIAVMGLVLSVRGFGQI